MSNETAVRDSHLEAITCRYEELYASIVEEVAALTPEERQSLIDCCKDLSMTNCSWLMYEASLLIANAFPIDEWRGVSAEGLR